MTPCTTSCIQYRNGVCSANVSKPDGVLRDEKGRRLVFANRGGWSVCWNVSDRMEQGSLLEGSGT